MGLFKKSNSSSPKHNLIEVIKYDGPNDILIWKCPNEDFNTNTQLIVGPSQEAIFVKGGQVLERFISGTYTLNTQNYPFIRSLVGLVTGGTSPFSCTVYYVNKAVSMGIDWGTDNAIPVIDPIYGIPVDVRSYGDFSVSVDNGLKLMEKLVGQEKGFSQQEIRQFFSNMMAMEIRGVIAGTMMEKRLSPIGIDAHLSEMSAAAKEKLQQVFSPFGMEVTHFAIASIRAPELDSIKQKARELQTHRMQTNITVEDMQKMAQARAFENRELNISEQEKMVGKTMQTVASNQGTAVGTGAVMTVGGVTMVNSAAPAAAGAVEMSKLLLSRTNQQADAEAKGSFEERARRAKFLLDNNMITQEQYQEKINQLMNEI